MIALLMLLESQGIVEDFSGHDGSNTEGYEGQHGGYGYGDQVGIREGKGFQSFVQL